MRVECPALLGRTLVLSDVNTDDLSPLLGEVIVLEKPFNVAELLDIVGLLSVYPVARELRVDWRSGSSPDARVISKIHTAPTTGKTYGTRAKKSSNARGSIRNPPAAVLAAEGEKRPTGEAVSRARDSGCGSRLSKTAVD